MNGSRNFSTGAAAGLIVGVLACALSVPPARSLIEQSMSWHMVVQMPMLLLGGWLLMGAATQGRRLQHLDAWNCFELAGFIASQVIFAYWMLPVSIDRAVVLPSVDLLKMVSLLVCGAMLGHSVDRSPAVVQHFFVVYAVSMLATTDVYLATTDRRLCNAYSLEGQLNAGLGVATLGVALSCAWGYRAVARTRQATAS